MFSFVNNSRERNAAAYAVSRDRSTVDRDAGVSLDDQRAGTLSQRKQMALVAQSNRQLQLQRYQDMMDNRAGEGLLQRAEEEEGHQVGMDELPESQAEEYIFEAFKQGEYFPPEVDGDGNVIQRAPKRVSYDSGEAFIVKKKDLDTGTDTTTGTRAYVNKSSTFKPSYVQFNYLVGSNKYQTMSNNMVFFAQNPKSSFSYSSGSYWDAGHKLAKQNGGYGDVNSWVFPQNPAFNQGNSKLLNKKARKVHGKTFPSWRAHEQYFHNLVKKNGIGVWWLQLS